MNLHDLMPPHPYDHVRLFTRAVHDRMWDAVQPDENDEEAERWINGTLKDIWLEDGRCFGLWIANQDEREHVLRIKDWDQPNRYTDRASLVTYRGQMRDPNFRGSWEWEVTELYTLDGRTSFDKVDRLDAPEGQETLIP